MDTGIGTVSETGRRPNNYFDGLPVSRRQILLLFTVVAAFFFEQMDNGNFSFVAPALIKFWGLKPINIGQISSFYFLGMTIGGLVGGAISDVIGRRKTFLGGLLLIPLASILTGLSPSFRVFLIARALTGFGIFCTMIVASTYIIEITPNESRGKWYSMTAGIGFLAVPAIGFISRAIVPTGPTAWRIIFYIGSIGFLIFLLGIIYLKESPRWLVSKGRVAEAEKLVEDISGVPVDLSEAAKNLPPKVRTSEALLGMFSRKYARVTIVLLVSLTLGTVGAFMVMVWVPTLLNQSGYTLQQSLTIGSILSFGSPIGIFLGSFVTDKGGRKIPMGISFLLVALFALIFANTGHNVIEVAIVGLLLVIVVMGPGFMTNTYTQESYPTRMRSTSNGIINAVARIATTGSQLVVPLIGTAYGFRGVYSTVAVLFVINAAVILIFGWRTGGKALEDIS